jgi:hypothetical protein
MPDFGPRRLSPDAGSSPGGRARRRGPGVAVLAVVAYGLTFLAALWMIRRESPLFSRAAHSSDELERGGAAPAAPGRAMLLAGVGLAAAARERYLSRLAVDRCDCGCGLTLRSCLVSDQACVRSPELARRRLSAAAAPLSRAGSP